MTQPGWYHAEGDASGTMRYWDGELWQGQPVSSGVPVMSTAPPGGDAPAAVEKLSPFGYWKKCWTRCFVDFSGRARRSEFGWFLVLNAVAGIILFIPTILVASVADMSGDSIPPAFGLALVPVGLFALASIIPTIAVEVRRWHDMGFSGWMALLRFIPLVGYVIILFLLFTDSKRDPNEWGRSPKFG